MVNDTPPTPRRISRSLSIILILCGGIPLTVSVFGLTLEKTAGSSFSAPVSIQGQLSQLGNHEYELRLAADEYAKVVVRQLGVDVTVDVQNSNATTTVDVASGSAGQEQVLIIGSTRLRVKASAGGQLKPGTYEIVIEERRPATIMDRRRLAAQSAFLEGERLRKRENRESRELAVTKLNEAISGWREVNDRREEALALRSRGATYFFLNMMLDSLNSYDEALVILRSLPNRLDEAGALLSLAITQLDMADSGNATQSFQRALELFKAENDEKFVGTTYYQLGRASYLLGDLTQAARYYELALPIRQRYSSTGEAYTLDGLGRVYANGFADYEQALSLYMRALTKLTLEDRRAIAQVRGDIGKLYFSQKNFEAALSEYQKALDAKADARVTAEILMYQGMVYAAKSHYQEALNSYNTALGLQCKMIEESGAAATLKNFKGESCDLIGAAHTLKNMGIAYSAMGDFDHALGRLNQALQIWTHVLYRTAEADTRYEIGRVQKRLGNLAEARQQLELAFPTIESLRTKIANQSLRTSYFASAQKFYELYIDVLMRQYAQTRDPKLEALALQSSERARTRSMVDTLIEARAEVRSGANDEDLEKEALLQRKLTLLSQRQMIDPGQSESQKVRIRQDLAALVAEYYALEARIRESSPRYAHLTHPEPLSVTEIQRLLAPDQMLLEYALGADRSYVWAVTQTSIKSYELPKREEIEIAADKIRSSVNEQNSDFAKVARGLSDTLLGSVEQLTSSHRLLVVTSGRLQYLPFTALPVPVRGTQPKLEDKRERVPLLVYHEVETLPSISVLAQLQSELAEVRRPAKRKEIIVIADPVFGLNDDRFRLRQASGHSPASQTKPASPGAIKSSSAELNSADTLTRVFNGDVPRLIFTRREADAILTVLPAGAQGDKILDFRANRQFVTEKGALSNYRIVHFATHGVVNDEFPDLSGIVLSLYDERRQRQNGLLQMHEIYNLNIPADLVVLSGCETGVGREIRGEGLPGLSRAFLYAGSRRVLVSLWKVSDASTSELMKAFYRHLFTQNRPRVAEALRQAQLEMWQKRPDESPYSWAAFITYGDSRF